MKPAHLGVQYILELYHCNRELLNDVSFIENLLLEAAKIANTTVVSQSFHQFSPHGVSGTVVITESHFNIHTWPEHGFAAVDLFTCGDKLNPEKAKEYLISKLEATEFDYSSIKRGILR